MTRAPRRGSGRTPAPPGDVVDAFEATVVRIGADGDAIAAMQDGTPLYMQAALPDERVLVRPTIRRGEGWAADLVSVEAPSADRVAAACRHFGTCGGCTLQHWRAEPYRDWKIGLLEAALRRAGFADPTIAPMRSGGPGQRRRLDLAVRRGQGALRLGLHPARSSDIVALTECPITDPRLTRLLAPLRTVLSGLKTVRREASVVLNLLDAGPDLLLRSDADLPLEDRLALTDFARIHDLPRISWARGNDTPEPVCVLRPPSTAMEGIEVQPPPGAFLQATREGERAIVGCVTDALRGLGRGRIGELYAGCGTITFALAAIAPVLAWEGDGPASGALRAAANRAGLAGRVTVTQRDLARQPLTPKDLSGLSAMVMDPPFNGTGPQMQSVAVAKIPVLVYISCNPAVLAREAAMLHAAGYWLDVATPVDQFLWSSRLETVCVFRLGIG